MAIKIYKRNAAGRRNMSVLKPDGVTDKKPERSLVQVIQKSQGRSAGKISSRHRGGGHRRRYRLVDFRLVDKMGVKGTVAAIEKDPGRSALIALVNFSDGDKRYVLAVAGMKNGSEMIVDEKAPVHEGNRMLLKNIPVGTAVCAVEMVPGKGAQIARGAGSSVVLQAIDAGKATLKMPSGEIRLVSEKCFATVGQISNFEHNIARVGSAGRKRHMGWRPKVRGTVMNPVDHPHGGGEGRQPIGLKYPKTPWGKPALGKKTRKKKRLSTQYIITRRKKRKK